MVNRNDRKRFPKESFLWADVKPETILGTLFLTMSNANINFQAWDLQWRFYTIENVFLTTRQIELIEKKEFVAAALDLEYKTFIIYVAAHNVDFGNKVHPSKRAQIAHLKADEAFTDILNEYTYFADVFLPKLVANLLKRTKINDHAI